MKIRILTIILVLTLSLVIGCTNINQTQPNQNHSIQEQPKKSNTCFEFVLTGNEVIDSKMCGTIISAEDASLERFGVSFPQGCKLYPTENIAHYCEFGNKQGENVNLIYCRPDKFMECLTVSDKGEVLDKKMYTYKKAFKILNESTNETCRDVKLQLIDIHVKEY